MVELTADQHRELDWIIRPVIEYACLQAWFGSFIELSPEHQALVDEAQIQAAIRYRSFLAGE
jgi:hypothetical protein